MAAGQPGDPRIRFVGRWDTSTPTAYTPYWAGAYYRVGFTGRTGGEMSSRCDFCLHAPSDSPPLIQQIHITAGHIICGLVEERLFPRG